MVLQLVAGSAIQAFEEVCPERIDLIHKNYRKLCNLLVDVEEWGQVVIINMLTRYCRTQFANPNAVVNLVHFVEILIFDVSLQRNACADGAVVSARYCHVKVLCSVPGEVRT